MAYKLQLKRGLLASLPNGSVGEPLFTTDTFDLYVGKGDGTNVKLQKFIASGSSSQFLKGDGSLDSTTYQGVLSGSGIVKSTGGTISYLTDNTANWDLAYNDKINSASVSGTTTKTLTLTQQDGGTITASWSDYDTAPVTSVFGRTGAVVAASGDYTTSLVTEGTNLYFTDARARAAITLTTTGSSGSATYVGGTLNIPTYTLAGLGGVPTTRSLTINGTSYDLSADRSWSVGTVTSVDLSVPTGFAISGNPITSSGTLSLAFATGYSLPTNASQTNWDAAYNDKINSASVTGTTTKTLTLNQQDGGTITASWTDINTDSVTSVFGRTGAVVAASGDYTTTQVTEGTNLYYTEARVSANTDVAANTAARHSAVTLGTANGLSLSTQQLSLALASGSTTGALSSSDWTTFNNKQNALTNPVTGTGTTNYLPKFTGTSTIGNSIINESGTAINVAGSVSATAFNSDGSTFFGFTLKGRVSDNYGAFGFYSNNGATRYGYLQSHSTNGGQLNITGDGGGQITLDSQGHRFLITGSEKMRLDASGNLGLGVTPSAWGTSGNLQLRAVGSQVDGWNVVNNAYENSGWKYASNGFANIYAQDAGRHIWYNAASGTAGNAISFTQAMTLDASGRLGIGTGSPGQKLQVENSADSSTWVKVSNSNAGTGAAAGLLMANDGGDLGAISLLSSTNSPANALFIRSLSTNPLVFGTANTERMRLTSTGLGIGTTSPNARLDLGTGYGASGEKFFIYNDNTTSALAGTKVGFYMDRFGLTNNSTFVFPTATSDPGSFIISSKSTSGTTLVARMTVLGESGNVGIGVTAPDYRLEVNGAIKAKGNIVTDLNSQIDSALYGTGQLLTSASEQPIIYLESTWNTTGNARGIEYRVTNTASGASSKLLNLLVGGTSMFTVLKTGSTGIGTGSPTEKLHVIGNVKFQTVGNGNAHNLMGASTDGGSSPVVCSNTETATTSDISPALNVVKYSTTTTSSARFIQFYANNFGTAMGGIVGNGTNNVQFATLSDIREKENIKTISGCLDKILALNPVEFDWIKSKEHIKAGFIAQEVETIFPEFVIENFAQDGEEARKGLTGGMTSGIIPILVKAIQELKAEIEQLKNK